MLKKKLQKTKYLASSSETALFFLCAIPLETKPRSHKYQLWSGTTVLAPDGSIGDWYLETFAAFIQADTFPLAQSENDIFLHTIGHFTSTMPA